MARGPDGVRRPFTVVSLMAAAAVVAWPEASVAAGSSEAPSRGLLWGGTTLAGDPVEELAGARLTIDPAEPVEVALAVVNRSDQIARPFEVRITGRVMGMTFFDYGTQIDAEVAPGAELERTVHLELDDLSDQGVGLVPTTVSLVDRNGQVLLDQSLAADVQGSMFSAYGIFGLAIAGSTLVLLGSLLLAIWRRMLPENRWRRALHFLPVGTGLGLTLTFSLSATRLLVPGAGTWVTFVVAMSAGAFALGYLLPVPYDDDSLATAAPA